MRQTEEGDTMEGTKDHRELTAAILERLGASECPGVVEEVAAHGADAGWPGFVYTPECVEFYQANKEAIWELLEEQANALGYANSIAMIADFERSDMLDTEGGGESP